MAMPLQHAQLVSKKPGRSTTGCSNCKIRKVKCDERKPACLRCQGRHLHCPGYPVNVLKWSSKHEVHHPGKAPDVLTRNRGPSDSRPATLRAVGSGATREERSDLFETGSSLMVNSAKPSSFHVEDTGTFANVRSPEAVDSTEITNDEIEQYSDGIIHAFEILTADLGLALSNAPYEHEGAFSPTTSSANESYPNTSQELCCSAIGGVHTADCSTNALSLDTDQPELYGGQSSPAEALILHSKSLTRKHKANIAVTPLSSNLIHVPTLLVEYYFQKVCRDCSTFDSPANPFRSRISEMRHTSAPIHYVIQSLAASKLADDMPRMKVVGIEAQGKALQTLKKEFAAVNALHAVSDEVLFTLLLLGMTTSWHTRDDLGLEYLHLARRIIVAKAQTSQTNAMSSLDFFENAIMYWTMIASLVSGDIEYIDTFVTDRFTTVGPSSSSVTEGIMPHPWAGISPRSLQLFGQVLQLIRRTRGRSGSKTLSSYSKAGIVDIANAIATAERLEAECWSVSIPAVNHLKDTGDSYTPPLHHVLTAKAYLMSALLHLYMIFPDVLETRILSAPSTSSPVSASEDYLHTPDSTHIMNQSYLWSQRSPGDDRDAWLKDVGHRIVECLESIDSRSSTRVVHPPLLLSVASALTLEPGAEVVLYQTAAISNARVNQCRAFIISRLETMQAAMRFHAIDNILKVIREIWKRSDAGRQDTFWMDVMSELNCETLFG